MTKAELRERITELQAENDALRTVIASVAEVLHRPIIGFAPLPKTRYGGES